MSLYQRLRNVRQVSDATRNKGIIAGILGVLGLASVIVAASPAMALEEGVSMFYGLSVVDWIFAALAIGMFLGFLYMKHVYLLYGTIVMAAGVVLLMVLGY